MVFIKKIRITNNNSFILLKITSSPRNSYWITTFRFGSPLPRIHVFSHALQSSIWAYCARACCTEPGHACRRSSLAPPCLSKYSLFAHIWLLCKLSEYSHVYLTCGHAPDLKTWHDDMSSLVWYSSICCSPRTPNSMMWLRHTTTYTCTTILLYAHSVLPVMMCAAFSQHVTCVWRTSS